MATCYFWGNGCRINHARSLELARESSGRGSRYGQCTLGMLHRQDAGDLGLAGDDAEAATAAFYRLAAAQGLDQAQFSLGWIHYLGEGVAESYAEALRWFKLAAAQGNPTALYWVAFYYHYGFGVAADDAEAIRWYRRAHSAGDPRAAAELEWFKNMRPKLS